MVSFFNEPEKELSQLLFHCFKILSSKIFLKYNYRPNMEVSYFLLAFLLFLNTLFLSMKSLNNFLILILLKIVFMGILWNIILILPEKQYKEKKHILYFCKRKLFNLYSMIFLLIFLKVTFNSLSLLKDKTVIMF
ncbi:hypothetical protein H312_02506 [Anncaliia algerae PRA339]|uniref:Uncharacterized protein n=1 Tax=Anncaliia algerae PRA339 TaxID=1288291 RepID=A0A059EZ34_9MICR|nr:hypothetical protein H312_02506 [Anncaliia algerae PRA339]